MSNYKTNTDKVMSSQIVFLMLNQKNKHRPGILSIHEPFAFSFSLNFELQNKHKIILTDWHFN